MTTDEPTPTPQTVPNAEDGHPSRPLPPLEDLRLASRENSLQPELAWIRHYLNGKPITSTRIRNEDLGQPFAGEFFRLLASDLKTEWPWTKPALLITGLYKEDATKGEALSFTVARLATMVAPEAGAWEWLRTAVKLKQREHWLPAAIELARLCQSATPGSPGR